MTSGISETVAGRRQATAERTQPRDSTERMNAIAKSVAVGILIALIGIGAFGRFYSARYNGLIAPQPIMAAEIADNMRHGHGLSTRVTYPLALRYASPDAEGYMPSLWGAPVYPLAMSLLFAVRGAGDSSVSLFNGLLLLITGWVMYSIARTMWDRSIGLFTTAIYFVSVDAIGNALTGSGVALAGLLVTAAIWALIRGRNAQVQAPDEKTRQRVTILWPALAGAIFGIAWLSGLTSLLLAIPLALLAGAFSDQRWRSISVFAAALAIVLAPWAIRNMVVAGTPLPPLATYELIANTSKYPGMTIYQQMPSDAPSPIGYAFSHPREMGGKMIAALIQAYRGGPRLLTPYLFPFLIFAAFIFGRTDYRRYLWRAVIAMLVLQTISLSLFSARLDGLAVVLPIAMVFAAGALIDVLRRTDASRWARTGVAAVIFALVLFPTATSALIGQEMPPARSEANLQILSEGLADDAVILTNDPAAVSWYSNKATLLFPAEPEDLAAMDERVGTGHHYVYLSGARAATVPQGGLGKWMEAFEAEGLEAYGKPARLVHPELFLEVVPKRVGQGRS